MSSLQRFINRLLPFIMLGVGIALAVVVFIFLLHVLMWGLLLGLVIYAVSAIKKRFFSKGIPTPHHKPTTGRIIEHDDS